VVVDFALTPDALDKLYKTLKETTSGRLIGLIGSCGDRDKEKRPKMGEIVASHCDITIVTDEEPYSEDPKLIMKAVLEGAKKVKKMGDTLKLIEDRYEAMEHAIKNAEAGDVIVVTGMGSFQTRTMNSGPMPWDDREIAREIIQKYS
jgi:UDP-N-acetylmuramoyl-L-alanyl-D-glutamate--2,6-diaminopimelate ligase